MWNFGYNSKHIIGFCFCLVICLLFFVLFWDAPVLYILIECPIQVMLPSLLISSLWMNKKRRTSHEVLTNDTPTKPDEYYYKDPRDQVVYLNHIVNKFRQDSNDRSEQLNDKSSRYGSHYSNLQPIDDTSSNNDYSSDADYGNYPYSGAKPNCNEGVIFLIENTLWLQTIMLTYQYCLFCN